MSRRLKITENILEMMQDPNQIRNIGLIGHIDHGKTTLSDSLLAEAGLLSKSLAGEARVLDYLEEEQRRGITMKSANISLRYDHSLKGSKPFLINLVDTPGHLDFSGKVTRALRLTDGVIVIVDSVEEVSSQTETVVRQALEEAVRPILFINKIDRLFKELKLDMEQIQDKFSRIIQDFNKLIFMFGNEKAKKEWMVSAEKGSVMFGSALHRWGFIIPQIQMAKKNMSYFKDVYDQGTYMDLQKDFPVWECVLAAVVQFLPNPLEAQLYRTETIWSGDIDTELGQAIKKCDPNGPLVIFLSKVQKIKNRLIGTARIFSGTLRRGQSVYIVKKRATSSINQLSIFMGARLESISDIPAGNIAAIGGIKNIKSGETLIDKKFAEEGKPFELVKYVSEPVVTVAVEPDMLKNLNQLQDVLEEIEIEDPNIHVEISPDSGECLLSGMGPLHLEVICKTVKDRGVSVEISQPTSVFHESVQNKSSYHTALSPNEANSITLKIERLEHETVEYLRKIKSQILENEILREQNLPEHTQFDIYEARGFWNMDRFHNVVTSHMKEDTLVEYDESDQPIHKSEEKANKNRKAKKRGSKSKGQIKQGISSEERDQILQALEGLCRHGAIVQEPLSELKIIIKDLHISSDPEQANYLELSTMLQNAFSACLLEAEPILLEPIYTLMITTPEEYIGKVTSLVNQYSGKILEITQDVYKTNVKAKMSVRQSIKFAQDIRGETSGRVFWQNLFDRYAPVPTHEKEVIISEIKFRKGLAFF
ncbi:MAG: GTP-binding protein [Promethearchaeota archaeon]